MSVDLLRGGRLGRLSDEAVEYTASTAFDGVMVEPVVKINMAHTVMLVKQGLVQKSDGARCLEALKMIPPNMVLNPTLEDVHMNVEAFVAEKAGKDAGGHLNLAKSRNDQVSAAIRMVLREYILKILEGIAELRAAVLEAASKHTDTVMPGYTHLQHAQPTTLAHHLTAHDNALKRDCERLTETYRRVNLNPLGAAAFASTGMQIDQGLATRLLGFDGLMENSMDAVSSRDFAIEAISNLALTMTEMSRMAEELILWSSREFGVVEIPDGYASTSSIMPQKKNAVVAELIRAKTSTIYGDLMASLSVVKALPLSYNLDLQQLTPHLWSACEVTLSSVKILSGMVKGLKFDGKRLRELLEGDGSTATDLADHLSTKYRIPFRAAHLIVGSLVRMSIEGGVPLKETVMKHLPEVAEKMAGVNLTLSEDELSVLLDPFKSVESRGVAGGPGREPVMKMIREGRVAVEKVLSWTSDRRREIWLADQQLISAVDGVIG